MATLTVDLLHFSRLGRSVECISTVSFRLSLSYTFHFPVNFELDPHISKSQWKESNYYLLCTLINHLYITYIESPRWKFGIETQDQIPREHKF
jgi:hypothetical protein